MDWFERLTGFQEGSYAQTRRQLDVDKGQLISSVNGRRYGIGSLTLPSLAELRRASSPYRGKGRIRLGSVSGDVRQLHLAAENRGALFQVASQFNLLEMVGPDITPEDGVTRYQWDGTQGPACAMAAGAATIYRNYFAPVGEQIGQTRDRQINTLEQLERILAGKIGCERALWRMANGYAFPDAPDLERIGGWLTSADPDDLDVVRASLRIGLHADVEVTDSEQEPRPLVSQAFCSAMPVSYSGVQPMLWRPLAQLILEAAYEATFHAAVTNAARGRSNRLLLTRLGGGAFGNPSDWIDTAIRRALALFTDFDLDVLFVSRDAPHPSELDMIDDTFGH